MLRLSYKNLLCFPFAIFITCLTTIVNAQISEERVVVGNGDCRTLRRAVHQRDGYIDIEIDRPYSKSCSFSRLALVIDNIAILGPSAVSSGIVKGNRGYEWDETRGTISFAYNKPLSAELINSKFPVKFGLIGLDCGRAGCLTEAAFENANVQSLLNEGNIQTALNDNAYAPTFARYQSLKDSRLLDALLTQVENDADVDRALALYPVAQDSKALATANQIALKNRTVSNLMKVYGIDKNRETLKLAYNAASTVDEKKIVELAVIQSIQDKLFDFKVSMSGTGKTNSSDTDVIFARVIQTNVTSTLTYAGFLKTDVFKPSHNYAVDTVVTLTVKGKLNGNRSCGLLWMSSCDVRNEDATRVYEYAIPMKFTSSNNYKATGRTDIDWKSVSGGSGMASGLLMGGTLVFSASGAFDIKVNIKSVSLMN
jgi:hypothetical protein